MQKKIIIKNVVSIVTYGRAGSGLLSSLFDGHNSVLSFPDCYLKSFYKFWEKYKNQAQNKIIKKFIYYYSIYFDPSSKANFLRLEHNGSLINKKLLALGKTNGFMKLGKNKNVAAKINKNVFLKNLNKILKHQNCSRKNFLLAVHLAYTKIYNPDIKPPFTLVYSLHSPDTNDLKLFKDDFPKAKFIQMIREPVSSFTSAVNSCIKSEYFKKSVLNYYTKFFIKKYTPLSKKNFIIKLENLHSSPKKIMKKTCRYIGLKYSSSLIKSTFFKKLWFNELNSSQLNGFNKKFIKKRINFFSKFDIERLEVLFNHNTRYFNYKTTRKSLIRKIYLFILIVLPFKYESQIQERYNFMDYFFYRLRILKNFFCA